MSTPKNSLVRELRQKKGLKQKHLAELTGLSRTMICHIETGRKGISYPTARALAKALRVSWKLLYTGQVPARVMAELHKDARP